MSYRNNDRRLKSGYSDLGRIQIPPRPQAILLTDRADGSLWMVSFNNTTSVPERLSIVDQYSTIQRLEGIRRYGLDDGPPMDEDGEFILIIRSGHIGLDYNPFPVWERAFDGAPPYARKQQEQRELILDSIDPLTVHLGYET